MIGAQGFPLLLIVLVVLVAADAAREIIQLTGLVLNVALMWRISRSPKRPGNNRSEMETSEPS